MAVVAGWKRSMIVPWILLGFAGLNILFLLTEIGINVLSAMLPLSL